MHDRLDHPAGHELAQPHQRVVAIVELETPYHIRGSRPGLLDGPGEGFGQYVAHLLRRLVLHHGVGVVVEHWGDLRAGEDEKADPVSAHLAVLLAGDEHPGHADGDVNMAR